MTPTAPWNTADWNEFDWAGASLLPARGLRWALVDPGGHTVAQFFDRKAGAAVEIDISGERRANITIPLSDPAMPLVTQALKHRLMVQYGDQVIHKGPILTPQLQFGTGEAAVGSVGPTQQLSKRFLRGNRAWAAQDQGEILMDLIEDVGVHDSGRRALIADDDFVGKTGNLGGSLATVGGTWISCASAGLGDPDGFTYSGGNRVDRISTGDVAGHWEWLNVNVGRVVNEVQFRYGAGSGEILMGAAVRVKDSTQGKLIAIASSTGITVYKTVAGVETPLLSGGAALVPDTTYIMRLMVDDEGYWSVWLRFPPDGGADDALPTLHGRDGDLAASGPLATGGVGVWDYFGSGVARVRAFESIQAWQPPAVDHGVRRGDIWPTITRTDAFEGGKNIWQAIQDRARVESGPDIEFEPFHIEGNPTIALFNAFWPQYLGVGGVGPTLGIDRTQDVVFEYGTGEMNCVDFVYQPDGTVVDNRHTTLGDTTDSPIAPSYVAQHLASQDEIGVWEAWESGFSPYLAIVTARAMEQAAAYHHAPPHFTVVPYYEGHETEDKRFGVPPKVFEQYGMGDTIRAVAKYELDDGTTYALDLRGRVTNIKLEEVDAAGNVKVTLTCIPTIDNSGVT